MLRLRWMLPVGLLAAAALGACGDDESDGAANVNSSSSSGEGGQVAQGSGGDGGMVGEGGDLTGGMGGEGGLGGEGGAGGMAPCVNELPPNAMPPLLLSQTGLYSDTVTQQLQPWIEDFEPRFTLWTDGAVKTRWVYLPCAAINNDDMDDWSLPVGTRFWKEFVVQGQRIETRLLHRFGPGPDDFLLVAYQWNAQQSEATRVAFGVQNAGGTQHDIPSEVECKRCHGGLGLGGLPSRTLGFGAIQLSHNGPGLTMATLSNSGRLTQPAAAGFSPPGDAVAQEALGYLHANCGMCHNNSVDGLTNSTLYMWLNHDDAAVEQTPTYLSAAGQPTVTFMNPACTNRLEPGDAAQSCIIVRMDSRAMGIAMPPLGTEVVDPTGVTAVSSWIDSLPSQ